MSQNTLIEKIKNDAAKAAEEIKAHGATEIENIQRDVEAQIADLTRTHEANLAKKKAQMKLVAVSKAKQMGKIAVQSAKRQQIDKILSEVFSELSEQDPDAYVKFFTKFVSEIVPENTDVVAVMAPKKRVAETETILKETGLSGAIETNNSFHAGVVIKAKDGVYDITLERLMTDKRAELEMIIVNKVGA